MEFVDGLSSVFGARGPRTFDSLLKFTDLSPSTQRHMQKVYATLAMTLLFAAAGCYINMLTGVGGMLGVLGFMACTIWLGFTPALPSTLRKREGLLMGAALCLGTSLGPLVNLTYTLHPGVLLTAFLGTAAIFLCFSGAALLARRRSYLFLGGMLSSVLAVFATMRLVTWFTGGGAALFEAELYLGLLVFLGYVLYDTQLAVEKAEAGDRDTVRAAQDLFIDFMAVFVRLLVILLRNAGKRDEEEGRDRRRSRGGRRRTEL
ncbi:hypothetical protein ACKKBF_B16115 [Auxenochlorella protothecoides x Auxenochlorella symbiontica]